LSVRLAPEAYAHVFALALAEEVVVPAPPTWGRTAPRIKHDIGAPTGVERADAISIRIPIEGADLGLRAESA
jgi:hypothetical protein